MANSRIDQVNHKNHEKYKWCDWDSNPGPQETKNEKAPTNPLSPPPPQEFFFHLIDQLMPQIYENFSYKFFRLETVPENWCSASSSSSSSDEDSDSDERDSGTRREFRELRR